MTQKRKDNYVTAKRPTPKQVTVEVLSLDTEEYLEIDCP